MQRPLAAGMDDGEDDGDIEILVGSPGKPGAVETLTFHPEAVEPLMQDGSLGAAGRSLRSIADREPGASPLERRGTHAERVIILSPFFLPHVEIGFIAMTQEEVDIALEKVRGRFDSLAIERRNAFEPAQNRHDAQGRPVMLGAGPA